MVILLFTVQHHACQQAMAISATIARGAALMASPARDGVG